MTKATQEKYPLPQTGFFRLPQIIGDCRKGIAPLIPVGRTTWWNGVKSGIYPKPIKLGPRITAWRVEDIYDLIERVEQPGLDRLAQAALKDIADSLREKGAGHLADIVSINNSSKELANLAREIELGGYHKEATALANIASDYQQSIRL